MNEVRSNNFGFINDYDYDPEAQGPLLAIVGDSYIEAAMVPFDQTVNGRVRQALDGQARVYSFGMSGAPLSQYLAYAEFARDRFRPDGLIVLVVGNDFDESLAHYASNAGQHHFVVGEDGKLTLQRVDFEVGPVRNFLRRSALARYLIINLHVRSLPDRIARAFGEQMDEAHYVGNTSSSTEPARVRDSQRAVHAFLSELPGRSGLPPEKILLALDGMRPHLYSADLLTTAKGSFVDLMRNYLSDRARKQGYEVLDMQPVLVEHFDTHRERFEFPNDGHWNALAHRIFAEHAMRSRVVATLR